MVLGENDRADPQPERIVISLDNDQIYIHQNYDEDTEEYDIAMIVLRDTDSVRPTHFVRPVCSPQESVRFYEGKPAVVSGWGLTSLGINYNLLFFYNFNTILTEFH